MLDSLEDPLPFMLPYHFSECVSKQMYVRAEASPGQDAAHIKNFPDM
jgi:hypothetical protein